MLVWLPVHQMLKVFVTACEVIFSPQVEHFKVWWISVVSLGISMSMQAVSDCRTFRLKLFLLLPGTAAR